MAQMLLQWSAGTGPLHVQLSDALGRLIELGELPPGVILPSERGFAAALAVSRTTVVAAYRTLVETGRLERHQGSGTRVKPDLAAGSSREIVSARLLAGDHAADIFLANQSATIDFSAAILPQLPLVAEIASSLTRDDYVRLGQQQHGYHPRGLPTLRERLAQVYTERGVPTSPEEILVTSGAQQALELIVAGCAKAGDEVAIEDPTYRGATETLTQANCIVHRVPSDENGIDTAAFSHLLDSSLIRLAYVQTGIHNPTGAALPEERGQHLARLADRHDTILVEDTSLEGTQLDGSIGTRLAQFGGERVLTVGSMSKLFWSGLRLGWIRASSRTIARLAQLKGFADLGTSLVSQQIGLLLLDHLDEARKARQEQLLAGAQTLKQLLTEHLPTWRWQEPRGGASLWITIPGADTGYFSQITLRYGVAILPGSVFSADGAEHTRLPYSLDPTVLRAGVQRLARAWDAYQGLMSVDLARMSVRS